MPYPYLHGNAAHCNVPYARSSNPRMEPEARMTDESPKREEVSTWCATCRMAYPYEYECSGDAHLWVVPLAALEAAERERDEKDRQVVNLLDRAHEKDAEIARLKRELEAATAQRDEFFALKNDFWSRLGRQSAYMKEDRAERDRLTRELEEQGDYITKIEAMLNEAKRYQVEEWKKSDALTLALRSENAALKAVVDAAHRLAVTLSNMGGNVEINACLSNFYDAEHALAAIEAKEGK